MKTYEKGYEKTKIIIARRKKVFTSDESYFSTILRR